MFIFRPSDVNFLGTKKIFFIILDDAAFLTLVMRVLREPIKIWFQSMEERIYRKETVRKFKSLILLKVVSFWTGGQIRLRASNCDMTAQQKI